MNDFLRRPQILLGTLVLNLALLSAAAFGAKPPETTEDGLKLVKVKGSTSPTHGRGRLLRPTNG